MMKPGRYVRQLVILQAIALLFLLKASPAVAQQRTDGDGDWTEVTRKAMPAVVSIVSFANGKPFGTGSGFIVGSDGIVVTNHHVIKSGDAAIVITKKGERYEVKGVIDYDIAKDFAILKIAAFDLPTVTLGNSNNLQVGEGVSTIGDPVDEGGNMYPATVATGIVSGPQREEEGSTWIQTTTPVTHGHSGGPLLNRRGEVIGIVSRGSTRDAEVFHRGVPINYVRGSLQLGTSIKYSLAQVAKEWSQIEAALEAAYIKKNFLLYRDPDGIFEVVSLSAWKVQREVKPFGTGGTLVQTVFAPEGAMAKPGGYLSEGMSINIILPPTGSPFPPNTMTELLNQYGEDVLRANKGFEITSTGMFRFNDMTAKVFRVSGTGPGLPVSEQNIYYVFGNEKAIVQLVVVQPDTKLPQLERTNELCAKKFALKQVYVGPSMALSTPTAPPPGVSSRAIETSFKSALYDDVIRLAPGYLQTNPNSAEANAYLGLSLLAKRDVDNAVTYLEKAISLGQQIILPVMRLREPIIGHALENATVTLSASGIVVTAGKSSYTGTFSSLSNSMLTNYNNQCSVASLQGSFVETSLKSEKTKQSSKTFNMFPPNTGLRPVQQGNMVVNYAVCDTQSLNTTAIIKLIAHLAAR